MGNIQVKDVPEELHEELRRRARQSNMTIRDYVLRLIQKDQALPTPTDWLEEVRKLPRTDIGRPAAEVIRELREERTARLEEVLGIGETHASGG